jgi:carbon-monoxide dehydrogenase medium subunit
MDELARRHGDYALAGVVLTVAVDDDGAPSGGHAAYLSCAPVPLVVDIGPALVVGEPRALYDLVAGSLDPTDDIHASGDYRRHLAATLTVRRVDQAIGRARAARGAAATEATA